DRRLEATDRKGCPELKPERHSGGARSARIWPAEMDSGETLLRPSADRVQATSGGMGCHRHSRGMRGVWRKREELAGFCRLHGSLAVSQKALQADHTLQRRQQKLLV